MPALKYCRCSGEHKERFARLAIGDSVPAENLAMARSLRASAIRLGLDVSMRRVGNGPAYRVDIIAHRSPLSRRRRSIRRPFSRKYGSVKELLLAQVPAVPFELGSAEAAESARVAAKRLGFRLSALRIGEGPRRSVMLLAPAEAFAA